MDGTDSSTLPGDEEQADDSLDETNIHGVLRNEWRRLTFERLRSGDGPESISDPAEHIAKIESDESPPLKNVRQSVYASLHRTHLPRLDLLRTITYDLRVKAVSPGSSATEFDYFLDDTEPAQTPFVFLSLATCLTGLALPFADQMGVPVIDHANSRLVAELALTAVAVVAGVRLGLQTRSRT